MSLEGFIGDGDGIDSPYYSAASAAAMGLPPRTRTAFNSPALSLTLKSNKMEGQSEMGLMMESFEPSLMGRIRDEGHESRSGSDNLEGASGDELDATVTAAATGGRQSRRKKYHRHTPFQIQELESYFTKINNHPDEKERLELGRRLSLESKQVKFWFQNRRTQMKTLSERQENNYLKRQNEELMIDNIRMKEAIRNPICTNCGGPAILGEVSIEEHHLRVENARLKDELNRISLLANKFLGRPISSLAGPFHPPMPNSGLELGVGRNGFSVTNSVETTFPIWLDSKEGVMNNVPMTAASKTGTVQGFDLPFDKSFLLELALRAMDELVKLAQTDDPMWVRSLDGDREALNHEEYSRTCPPCIGSKPNGFVTEATRATGPVIINSLSLVEMLMDSNQWADMFPCLIGRSSIIDVIFGGMGGSRNGALQQMHAEFQALSHLVPVRQMKFLRFCKQHGEGLWAVVDVSIDSIREGSDAPTFMNCRRLASGCIVQDMPNGYSKVTWIEHTEYDENIIHNLYRPLVSSGMGFGAQRWLAALQRQCDCLAILMSSTVSSDDNSGFTLIGKRSMAKLAHRMTRNFSAGVCATMYMWRLVQLGNVNPDTRLIIRNSSDNPGEPSGLVLSATTSVWIPVTHQNLFNFLRDEQLRSEWDELSNGGPMQEMVHIAKGQDHASCVSLLRASAADANQNTMLILQETQTDETGSIIVYAPIDIHSMQMVLGGGDSATVALLPSGFAIAPDGFPSGPENGNGALGKGSGGSLLTVGFQILVNNPPSAKLTMESVETVNSLIGRSIQRIKAALHCT